MLPPKLYFFLCFLIGFCFCGPTLEAWSKTDKLNDKTWHADFPLGAFDREPLSNDGVLVFAKSYYAKLEAILEEKTRLTEPNAAELVAALYVPSVVRGNKGHIYISTIPRGSRKTYMAAHKTEAPVWGAQVAALQSTRDNHANPFHAEDGVYFNFETTDKVANRVHYPPGSMIAVFGRFTLDGKPERQALCGAAAERTPSCMAVAEHLPVGTN